MTTSSAPRARFPRLDGGTLSIIGRVLTLIGSRAGGMALTLVYTLLIARITSIEDFGLFMTAFSWSMLISIVLSLNVEAGSIRYLVGYKRLGEMDKVSGFLRFNLYTVVVVSLIVTPITLLISAMAPAGSTGFRIDIFSLLTAPVFALIRVYGRHATALGQVLSGQLPRMLVRPAVFCAMLGPIYLIGTAVGVYFLTGLLLVATILTAALQFYLLRDTFRFAKGASPRFDDWRSWVQTGAMMAPLLLMRENLKNVIVVAAGFTLAADQLGHLAIALSILGIIYFGVQSVDISISPRLSKALQAGEARHARKLLTACAGLKILGTVLGIVVLEIVGRWVLGLFGPEYVAAFLPLQVLMLIPAADAIFGPTYMVLNVSGRPQPIFWVSILSTVLIVIAASLTGIHYGAAGAAFGASLGYLVQQMLLWLSCRVLTGVDPSVFCILQRPKALPAKTGA